MKVGKIKVGWNHRFAIIGGTGSGKTFFSKVLLSKLAQASKGKLPIYILDTKISGDFTLFYKKGIGKLYTGNNIPPIHDTKKYGAFQVWQPLEDDRDVYNEFFKQIYETRQPAFIYIDELSSITNGLGMPPRYYDILLRQGRGLNVGVASVTQSSTYIPHSLIRQANHCIRFRLNDDTDVKKLESVLGKESREEPKDEHGFYYRDISKPKQTNKLTYYPDLSDFF